MKITSSKKNFPSFNLVIFLLTDAVNPYLKVMGKMKIITLLSLALTASVIAKAETKPVHVFILAYI